MSFSTNGLHLDSLSRCKLRRPEQYGGRGCTFCCPNWFKSELNKKKTNAFLSIELRDNPKYSYRLRFEKFPFMAVDRISIGVKRSD